MNIELIKKYKTEFDHFINGGKLLIIDIIEKKWCTLEEAHWDRDIESTLIVIDNEYSTFTKALAEGKTIQRLYVNPTIQLTEWVDSNIIDMLNFSPKHLRIKPEEPQFKVGDFVRVTKSIIEYDGTCTIKPGTYQFSERHMWIYDENPSNVNGRIKLWTPQAGELCWFGYSGISNQSILSTFHSYGKNGMFKDIHNNYEYCEPFLGTKPSWFKD